MIHALLHDENRGVRQRAAGLLGPSVLRSEEAATAIMTAYCTDPHPSVRKPALTLVSAHYIYWGFQHGGIGHLFVRESAPDVHTIHAHVVPYPSTDWNEYVCFRDLLKAKKTVKRDYQKLKQASATRLILDRKAYTASKHEFI